MEAGCDHVVDDDVVDRGQDTKGQQALQDNRVTSDDTGATVSGLRMTESMVATPYLEGEGLP
jgi:hypothetical protein